MVLKSRRHYCGRLLNTKKDIERFYKIPPGKIKVVYLGVNDIYFHSKPREKIIKEKYYFSITTHQKRKNITGVLDAIALTPRLREYKYVIAGLIPENQLKELKQQIAKLKLQNCVILLGYVSEHQLVSLYQNAEFFIYPSLYEGFGFPVLEAMASGCPVITSNNSSLTEITPDKKWLINPLNVDDMAKKMKEIISLSEEGIKSLKERNRVFAQQFTWDKTAKEMLDVFNSLKPKSV